MDSVVTQIGNLLCVGIGNPGRKVYFHLGLAFWQDRNPTLHMYPRHSCLDVGLAFRQDRNPTLR